MKLIRVITVAVIVASALVLSSGPAGATVNVTTFEDEQNSDGDCSLREAVASVVSGSAVDACDSTVSPIVLGAGTYQLDAVLNIGADLSIVGAGRDATVINADSSLGVVINGLADVDLGLSSLSMGGGASTYVNGTGGGGSIIVRDATLDAPGSYGINASGSPIVAESVVISGSGSYGINNNSGNVDATDTAVDGSGSYGINTNAGELRIERSSVTRSGSYGLNSNGGSVTIVNSTVSGAGSYLVNSNSGPITVDSATLVGSDGYGINSNATLTLTNSIISDMADVNCNVGGIVSGGFNLSDDDTCGLAEGTDLEGVDPVLGPLADNGGTTLSMVPEPGSPALDNGGDCPAVDQRGEPRPADGNDDGDVACDRGAIEVQPPPDPTVPPAQPAPDTSPPPVGSGGGVVATPRFTG